MVIKYRFRTPTGLNAMNEKHLNTLEKKIPRNVALVGNYSTKVTVFILFGHAVI